MVAACDGGDGPLFDNGSGGSGDGGAASTAGEGGAAGNGSGEGGTTAGASSGGAAGATGCPRACGPTFEQFFDDTKLATLRITIDAADLPGFTEATWLDALWEQWKHCAPFTWVKSSVQYESPDGLGDITLNDVGMRLRGSMKRGTNQIQGFKLDFQVLDTPAAEGKRRFADLNRVNVLSVESDPSHMIQCLAYKMLRDAGVPAPRCNHLKIYVNGEYYGLMQNVEQVNKGYLRRHFGTSASSLYAGSPSMGDCPSPNTFKDSQAMFAYSGDSFASYTSQYQLTHASAA
ncbi:MAG TPA: CotH kinase family protein, partial [Polyangiaceae bacterium]|nr:CotH kinase family protein [Polyangiaceae bacterium]